MTQEEKPLGHNWNIPRSLVMRLLEEDDRARASGEYDQPTVWRLKCLERLSKEAELSQSSEHLGSQPEEL